MAATAAEVEKVLRKDLREMEKLSSGLESRIAEGNSYIGLAVAQERAMGKLENSRVQNAKAAAEESARSKCRISKKREGGAGTASNRPPRPFPMKHG